MQTVQRANINIGFSNNLLTALKTKCDSMPPDDRQCVLIFDEMSIKSNLTYNENADFIEGFEDLGSGGRSQFVANHVLAFMVRGLRQKWKQPLCYYLTSGTAPAKM